MNLGREMTASLEGKYSLSMARGAFAGTSAVSLAMLFQTASRSGLQNTTIVEGQDYQMKEKNNKKETHLLRRKDMNSTNSVKSSVPL
jgi:hypothetical protein